MNDGEIKALQEIIDRSRRIVFFCSRNASLIITGNTCCIRKQNLTRRTGNCSNWSRRTSCGAS